MKSKNNYLKPEMFEDTFSVSDIITESGDYMPDDGSWSTMELNAISRVYYESKKKREAKKAKKKKGFFDLW